MTPVTSLERNDSCNHIGLAGVAKHTSLLESYHDHGYTEGPGRIKNKWMQLALLTSESLKSFKHRSLCPAYNTCPWSQGVAPETGLLTLPTCWSGLYTGGS